jgi:hypothetical protein
MEQCTECRPSKWRDEGKAVFEIRSGFQEIAAFFGVSAPASPSSTRSTTALAKAHLQLFYHLLFTPSVNHPERVVDAGWICLCGYSPNRGDNPANRGGPTCTEFGNGGAVGRFMCYLDHLQATVTATSPTDHLPTSESRTKWPPPLPAVALGPGERDASTKDSRTACLERLALERS